MEELKTCWWRPCWCRSYPFCFQFKANMAAFLIVERLHMHFQVLHVQKKPVDNTKQHLKILFFSIMLLSWFVFPCIANLHSFKMQLGMQDEFVFSTEMTSSKVQQCWISFQTLKAIQMIWQLCCALYEIISEQYSFTSVEGEVSLCVQRVLKLPHLGKPVLID